MDMTKKLNQMVSSVLIICLCLCCGCQGEKQIKGVENGVADRIKSVFVPDISVNEKLLLNDYGSLQKFYPKVNSLKLIEFIRETPIIIFCNVSKNEYLYAYQYEGNLKNEFSCFEIGYCDEEIKNYAHCDYKSFVTESGLQLGLTLEEVEKIKGKNYTKQGNKITYLIEDSDSVFLRNYNMPGYFLECILQQNKVVKIKFGFVYP